MKFKVQFISKGSEFDYAINVIPMDIGLHGVDQIREELDLPKFHLERIGDKTTPFLQKDPSIVIDEKMARESGLFETTNHLIVSVPPNALNEYVYMRTKADKDKTGEIRYAYLRHDVHYNRILAEWRDAGFPLKWLFEKEEDI
jgi:hypothetical protein